MSHLKPCQFVSSDPGDDEDDDGGHNPKRQKTIALENGSWSSDPSHCRAKTQSNLRNQRVSWPVKTSRSCIPAVLPEKRPGAGSLYLERRDANKKIKHSRFEFDTYLFKKNKCNEERPKLPIYEDHPYCVDIEGDKLLGYFGAHVRSSITTSLDRTRPDSSPESVKDDVENSSNAGKTKRVYKLMDFDQGDIVWAKAGKNSPAWPAIVIDPVTQAPDAVLRETVPNTKCVMYFGHCNKGKQIRIREYSWVKGGMIFPFNEYFDSFKGQTGLYKNNLGAFKEAVEEACTADKGPVDVNHLGIESSTDKLQSSKQGCGICKKIRHHSDGENWVRCDGCDVSVHAECAELTNKHLKDLENSHYYCADCKPMFDCESPSTTDQQPKVKQKTPPDKITIVCNGMEATYLPDLHMVECNCGSCGSRKQTLSEWERHTGCRAKKWKYSVKVKGSTTPLSKWVCSLSKY